MTTELSLDWLISVDDHVLGAAATSGSTAWRPRTATARPTWCVEGDMEFWVYDGKRYPSSGLSAVAGKSKEEFSPEPRHLRRDAAGLLRPQGAHRGHGPRRDPGLAVLPDDHSVLRAALHGGRRPGVRLRVPSGLQRLDDRGVVRGGPGPLHPADPDPHVGPAAGGQGDGALRGQGRHRVRLLGEPGAAGPADHPRHGPLLGPGHGGRHRARDGRLHARRLVVAGPPDRPGLAVHGQPGLGCHPHLGSHAVLAVQRHVHRGSRT